ncbi:MAG: anthranilate synthase component [Synergistales bacterium]|nr:anthranilate synthase component [Synergistales bacterium]
MLLMIDNYDSFTYNLVQCLSELDDVEVRRNDGVSIRTIARMAPRGIVISPGPGTPRDAGVTMDVIRAFAGRIPILGVCLGHQAIAEVFGGRVVRGREPFHGKVSVIHHDGSGIFEGLESPLSATRYHSLTVDPGSVPPELAVTAWTDDGTIMGLSHREKPLYGVQFHPESILTERGMDILKNFSRRAEPIHEGSREQ